MIPLITSVPNLSPPSWLSCAAPTTPPALQPWPPPDALVPPSSASALSRRRRRPFSRRAHPTILNRLASCRPPPDALLPPPSASQPPARPPPTAGRPPGRRPELALPRGSEVAPLQVARLPSSSHRRPSEGQVPRGGGGTALGAATVGLPGARTPQRHAEEREAEVIR
jgi:hypothetical protein